MNVNKNCRSKQIQTNINKNNRIELISNITLLDGKPEHDLVTKFDDRLKVERVKPVGPSFSCYLSIDKNVDK